jgi:hypothetical protein
MNLRQMELSMPDGSHATLAFPEPATLETIAELEEASAAMFESLRRSTLKRRAQQDGAIEYDSWFANRDAGAIEYDSWAAGPR